MRIIQKYLYDKDVLNNLIGLEIYVVTDYPGDTVFRRSWNSHRSQHGMYDRLPEFNRFGP